jgi:hypothetical protein
MRSIMAPSELERDNVFSIIKIFVFQGYIVFYETIKNIL